MDVIIPLLICGLPTAATVVVGFIFYMRSKATSALYYCPECDEEIRVELMEAQRCNVCGAALRRAGKHD